MHKEEKVVFEGTTKSRKEMRQASTGDEDAALVASHRGWCLAMRITARRPRENARLDLPSILETMNVSSSLLAACVLLGRGSQAGLFNASE